MYWGYVLKTFILTEVHDQKSLVAALPILLLKHNCVHRNKYVEVHPDQGESILHVYILFS